MKMVAAMMVETLEKFRRMMRLNPESLNDTVTVLDITVCYKNIHLYYSVTDPSHAI
jgi:hypothetical protein